MISSQVLVSTCKRKRGPNWSEKEKQVLVEEYRRRRHILRPKGPALSSVSEREKAWEEICEVLQPVSGPYIKRDVVDMRKKWDNLCFWAKKCIAEWKEKNSADGGLQAAVSGENTPPTLALKILAIYQDEWSDLFPNAQVVDGGDVFFVFNNDNTNTPQLQIPKDNMEYPSDNGDGSKSKMTTEDNGDVFEVVDEDVAEVKMENGTTLQDADGGWQPDTASGADATFQDFSADTATPQAKRAPQETISSKSLPHRFIQRRYSIQASSPPVDNNSLPHSARSSSPTAASLAAHPIVSSTPQPAPPSSSSFHLSSTANSHTPPSSFAASPPNPFMPYHFHSSVPSSLVPNHQHPQTSNATNNIFRASNPPSKRMRYSNLAAEDSVHSDVDDDKDIEQLSREMLILRKEKLILEKQKLEIEKEKLVIERDILDMQRERQWLDLEKDRMANGHMN